MLTIFAHSDITKKDTIKYLQPRKEKAIMRRKSVKNSLTVMCLAFVLVSAVVIGSIAIYNIGIMTSLANKNHQADMEEIRERLEQIWQLQRRILSNQR